MTIHERVIDLIVDITRADEVRDEPDIALYELGLIDSLGTVELIVALSSEFGLEISPVEVDRAAWSTPGKIAAYVEQRLALHSPG